MENPHPTHYPCVSVPGRSFPPFSKKPYDSFLPFSPSPRKQEGKKICRIKQLKFRRGFEIEMFGAAASCNRRERSVDPGGIASIWPNYFPEIEPSMDDPRFKFIAVLADFFSNRQADGILSQAIFDPFRLF